MRVQVGIRTSQRPFNVSIQVKLKEIDLLKMPVPKVRRHIFTYQYSSNAMRQKHVLKAMR